MATERSESPVAVDAPPPDGVRDCDIAVIMPVLNAEETIATQLEALSRQTYPGRWQLIIADNGSKDRGLEIARGYADRLPLRVVDASTKRGAAHARNVGAEASDAPLLAFVDADDEVSVEWLEEIANALVHHSAVASRFDKERLNPPELRATRNLAQEKGLGEHNYAAFLPHAGGSGLAVHRSIHEKIGGFDERLLRLQDTDYCWRIQLAGHTLHYASDAVLHVRFRPEGGASLRQAFTYGRYDGRLYHRYRTHGMQQVPLGRTLKQVTILLAKLLMPGDADKQKKRRRSAANLLGIVVGRTEARWSDR